MKCNNCGADVGENDAFCTYCGSSLKRTGNVQNEVTNAQKSFDQKPEENKETKTVKESKSKKRSPKVWLIVLVSVLAALFVICGAVIAVNILNKGGILSKKIDRYEGMLTNLTLAGDVDEVRTKIEEGKQYIQEKRYKEADSSIQKIEELMDKLEKENETFVKNKLDSIYNSYESYLTDDEKKELNERKSIITNYINKKLYIDANDGIEELSKYIYKITEPKSKINVDIKQVDVSDFPKVKLYVSMIDENKKVPSDLKQVFFTLSEKEANGEFVKRTISKVTQLNENENLNIDMVMDVSGSMSGKSLTQVKSIMNSFVDSVQFDSGDLVELTTFSSDVNINCEFTNDKQTLKNKINGFSANGVTSLYDALYLSVNRVATKSGAKCVIAFTDGLDNNSRASVTDVINQAQKYQIPIFLIGSDLSNSELEKIATSTGGFYKKISDITSLKDVYDSIYLQQKELYLVEYEDSNSKLHDARTIRLEYRSREFGGTEDYTFEPKILRSTGDTYGFGDGPEGTVINYLHNFVVAITNKDFSKISDYLLTGSNIYNTQREYINKDIEEKLLSYEILDVDMKDASNAIVSTRETYWVKSGGKLIQMLTQECKYNVEKSGDSWKLTDFADKVNVVSNIKY